ncbi:MAG: hypothetical protein WAS25_10465 [Geothrix sp.]|uniref:hypothetical protein n=1 Tax=Geothrix sp. TaxID=1962974 RepID=UPI003BB0F9B9
MKRQNLVALLATLMTATAWGQEVSLYGTTMAQMWKSETVGFDKATYTPATQYLGIDANKLGSDNLSLHLFGWGRTDLSDSSNLDGSKTSGYLNFGYLQYRFNQANAEVKAGRFTVSQGTGFEQVDGVSLRTDLRGGFTFSAFGGKPVLYKTVDLTSQKDYDFQRDVIYGTRLGWRIPKVGEIGVSYLQDGTKAAKDLPIPSTVDYSRKQMGVDLLIAPAPAFQLRGRTIFDLADHAALPAGTAKPSNIAEHDYTAIVKFGSKVTVTANVAERNFYAYFAGTNLPSLFRQDEKDKYKGYGGSLTVSASGNLQLVADFRHMNRESFGDVTRVGGEVRYASTEKHYMAGLGMRSVSASKTIQVDPTAPGRSLSHTELRAFTMIERKRLSLSLDGIFQQYKEGNPYLNGLTSLYEVVASVGFKATENLKLSGDISRGSTPVAKDETRGLLRAEYRFGFGKKGGQ